MINHKPTNLDEIPEAKRDGSKPAKQSIDLSSLVPVIIGLVSLGVLTLVGVSLVRLFLVTDSKPNPVASPNPSPSPTASPVENILGHLAYAEAPVAELIALTADGSIKLRSAAADKFLQMQAEARAQGVRLVPLSGFRTVAEQDYLFFRVKEQRNQPASKRAEVSAPPKHSEHHTGYAIDIGDANLPGTNLSTSFETTVAFRWLENNANRYSFELSFPRNNPQGISYEPWHWRFVGDRDSLETFYKARQLNNKAPAVNQ